MTKRAALIIVVPILLTFFMGGCDSKKNIVGTVVDNFGAPIPGAKVLIEGTNFAAVTDASGAFSLEYAPGELKVLAMAEGHTYESRPVLIPHRVRYRLEKFVLMAVPANDGLRVQSAKEYVLIPHTKFLRFRRVVNATQQNQYCLDSVVPSNLPSCTARQFVAFATSPGKKNLVLVQPKDGVVWSTPVGVTSSACMVGNPGVVTDAGWTEMGPQVVITGNLKEGIYCLVETHQDEATNETSLDEGGACFRWTPEAMRTTAK